jgi:GTPase
MFCDETEILIKAGKGGTGIVSFRHERLVSKGGPDGGDGGTGGSIYVEVDPELNTLSYLHRTKTIKTSDGGTGGKKKMRGKNGQELILKVPQGTVIYDKKTKKILADLTKKNQKFLLAFGGKGGFGNAHFTSSTRQTPDFAESGEPGQERLLRLELKLIADVGIIGLPNVGKSTLLSRTSAAKPKIADYPFTTLVPNLGIVQINKFSFTACDIPGLIEKAYKGKGLGDKFLRHIERCRLLIHLLDITSEDLTRDYKIINQELKKFSSKLTKKPQILVVNKIDAIDSLKLKVKSEKLKKLITDHQLPIAISAVSGEGIKELLYEIKNKLEKIPLPKPKREPIKVFKPYERLIKIEKEKDHFIILGKEIESLAQRTDFKKTQALSRFYNILKRKGVLKELLRSGAKPGNKIKIGKKTILFTGH